LFTILLFIGKMREIRGENNDIKEGVEEEKEVEKKKNVRNEVVKDEP